MNTENWTEDDERYAKENAIFSKNGTISNLPEMAQVLGKSPSEIEGRLSELSSYNEIADEEEETEEPSDDFNLPNMVNEASKLIKQLGDRVVSHEITWNDAACEYNLAYGESLSGNAMRKRYKRRLDSGIDDESGTEGITEPNLEFETHYDTGYIDIQRRITFDPSEEKSPETILRKFGYDPALWILTEWRFGRWEVAMKKSPVNRQCTTIRAKIKPRANDITPGKAAEIANQVLVKDIEIFSTPKPCTAEVDGNRMMEIPPIELHLGKLAWHGDTGEDYDRAIASKIFKAIFERIIHEQDYQKCASALLLIGSDFFNSDTAENTTTKGTQQYNDMRFPKMFSTGIELYKCAIENLLEKFEEIYIELVQGNHDYMMSYFLVMALKQYYSNNPRVTFSEETKETKGFRFGEVGLFFNHGDANLKRLQLSIPAEFYDIWGKTQYRELHLGHLHKEVVVDDNMGMITRRIGSPTGIDAWHYQNRFIGATQKHQVFIWDKKDGLMDCIYIPVNKKAYKK